MTWVFGSFRVPIHVGTSELGATSTKMYTLGCHISKKGLNVFADKSGKYVGAILRMAFECLPFVIMAKM
jgi:hypothetical protein